MLPNLEGYEKLCEIYNRNNKISIKENWFEVSEPVFKNQPLESKHDFIKIIAFAYSWMPTIPKLNGDIDWNYLFPLLKSLQQGDMSLRLDILNAIVPYINNSVVGSSKVLHYIAPEIVPIIDSRVINTWTKLFVEPKFKKYKTKLPYEISCYLQYWDILNSWISVLDSTVKLRDIEGMLYGIDGDVAI